MSTLSLLPTAAAGLAIIVLVLVWILWSGTNLLRCPIDWKQETVLVTGGSQGLGLEFVQQVLARHDPRHMVVLGIKRPQVPFAKDKVTFYECDVAEFETVKRVGEAVLREVGAPTIVINNAGILGGKRFVDLDPATIERVIKVNLLGPMWVTKVFLPSMLERNHGHIINVCSALSLSGSSGVTEYCASKFGLSGFTESLIQETKHTNVRVSAIFPGLISTSLFRGVAYRYPSLFPTLHARDVAAAIRWIVENDASVELVLPWIANLGRAMKVFPVAVQGLIKDLIGANSSMDTYKRAD
ncbi:hypothetical protein BC830DRAFT_1134178 [Chytriomyces sp. MP71]|nr:hypothetical protein BC830DRAFT_1134178 [Chytriomyces sp. MP71]